MDSEDLGLHIECNPTHEKTKQQQSRACVLLAVTSKERREIHI